MDQVVLSRSTLPESGKAANIRQYQVDTTTGSSTDTLSLNIADSIQLSASDCTMQPGFIADSLGLVARYSESPLFRYSKDPSEVFGSASVAVGPSAFREKAAHPLTDNPVFQSFVLLLAATYIFLLYRHLNDIIALFRRLLRTPASGKRFSDDQKGIAFSRFLNITAAIGALFIGVIVVKAGDLLLPAGETEAFSKHTAMIMSILATGTFAIIAIYQLSILHLAGALTLSRALTSQLILLKRIYFALTIIIISPVLLLYALCPPGTGKIWLYTILIQSVCMLLLYLEKTLSLFLVKKVSILHWFLYLCTIEIFPFSLLWMTVIR